LKSRGTIISAPITRFCEHFAFASHTLPNRNFWEAKKEFHWPKYLNLLVRLQESNPRPTDYKSENYPGQGKTHQDARRPKIPGKSLHIAGLSGIV
jgi:hypothetical protein